jgi:hypothetical protein
MLSAILNMDEFPKIQRLNALCKSLAVLLKFDAELSSECSQIVDKTIQFISEQFEDYDEQLRFGNLIIYVYVVVFRLSIFTFVSLYASKSLEKCNDLSASLTSSSICKC